MAEAVEEKVKQLDDLLIKAKELIDQQFYPNGGKVGEEDEFLKNNDILTEGKKC